MTAADLGGRVTAAITTRRAELDETERLATYFANDPAESLESVGRERAMLNGYAEIAALHVQCSDWFAYCAQCADGDEDPTPWPCATVRAVATGLGLEP